MKVEDEVNEPLLANGVDSSGEEPKSSAASKTFWYCVMFLIHCGWGILPVNARYLQTQASPPLGAFRLGFYIAGFAAVALLTITYIPIWIYKACTRPPTSETEDEIKHAIPRDRFWEWVQAISILSCALGALAFGQIFATNFTSGDWVQLISMTAPLFVAILASMLLGIPVPGVLYPTLLGVLAGAGLVIYGGMQETQHGMQLTSRDFIGFGTSLIATLGMAVFYVYVQKTEGLVGEDQVLVCEYAVMCATLPPLSVVLEDPNWDALLHYDWVFWAHLIFCSVLVYYGCNLIQQFVIRNVGANVYAMTSAIRLVASIIASWVLLDEKITSWMQWLGCLIVVCCILGYLYVQFYGSYDTEAAEAALESDANDAEAATLPAAPQSSSPIPAVQRSAPVAIQQPSSVSSQRGVMHSGSLKQRSYVGTPGTMPV